MKKVLFVFLDFFGYEKRIIKLIEEVLGYEVFFVNLRVDKKKKNIFENIYNRYILKPFFKTNLNDVWKYKKIVSEIKTYKEVDFDYIFCIRPDMIGYKSMEYIKKMNKKMILHIWDSLSWCVSQKEYLHYFDKISTFDKKESETFKMDFAPNFYIKEYVEKYKDIEIKNDIFTVMAYDNYRTELLEKIARDLKEKKINYKFIVVIKENMKNYIKNDYLTFQTEKMNIEETYKNMMEAKAVLEIGHSNQEREQGGLSFRAIEALGCKRKLITTYDLVKDYDFYNENNIKVISKDNFEIEREFFEIPYEKLSNEIYEDYSDESWIRKIFIGNREK